MFLVALNFDRNSVYKSRNDIDNIDIHLTRRNNVAIGNFECEITEKNIFFSPKFRV